MNGKLAAVLDLKTFAHRAALARVAPDGTVSVSSSFDAGVPFFVWAEVPRWIEVPIPAEIRFFADLEGFVPRAAKAAGLDAEKPLPFWAMAVRT